MADNPEDTGKDFYQILGISRAATDAEIKKAYRKLAIKHHPDKQKPSKAEAATQKLARINEAYTVLGDADKRRMHDLQRSDAAGPSSGMLSAGHPGRQGQHTRPSAKPELPIPLPSRGSTRGRGTGFPRCLLS